MGRSKKKRKDSEFKLGYGVIYDYGLNTKGPKKKKRASVASLAAEDKDWKDVSALELRKLMVQGWKTDNFISHYGITLNELYRKLRFGWALPNS